jgi:hypothetical protein
LGEIVSEFAFDDNIDSKNVNIEENEKFGEF